MGCCFAFRVAGLVFWGQDLVHAQIKSKLKERESSGYFLPGREMTVGFALGDMG